MLYILFDTIIFHMLLCFGMIFVRVIFYVIGIFYGKKHFSCNWVVLSGFKNVMKYFEEV